MAIKLKWGVLGAGGIAFRRTIPEGIVPAKNAELSGVYDVVKVVADQVGRQFGAPVYADEKALLAADLDVVYIATPAAAHYRQALAALRAGKHVLIEKPMALTLDECRKILAQAKKSGRKVGVDFMMRFHAHHREIKKIVESGRLGKPVMARAQLSCWYPPIKGAWRQIPKLGGGGSFMDMGCHCIDILEFVLGSKVKEVSCVTGSLVQKYAVEDTAVLTARFANGAIGIVDACFSIPDNSSKNILEVYGSRGSILCRGTIGQAPGGEATSYLERAIKGYDARQARSESAELVLKVKPSNLYRAQVEFFSDAVLKGGEVPVSGDDGLWNQKIMLAAYESAKKGKSVLVR